MEGSSAAQGTCLRHLAKSLSTCFARGLAGSDVNNILLQALPGVRLLSLGVAVSPELLLVTTNLLCEGYVTLSLQPLHNCTIGATVAHGQAQAFSHDERSGISTVPAGSESLLALPIPRLTDFSLEGLPHSAFGCLVLGMPAQLPLQSWWKNRAAALAQELATSLPADSRSTCQDVLDGFGICICSSSSFATPPAEDAHEDRQGACKPDEGGSGSDGATGAEATVIVPEMQEPVAHRAHVDLQPQHLTTSCHGSCPQHCPTVGCTVPLLEPAPATATAAQLAAAGVAQELWKGCYAPTAPEYWLHKVAVEGRALRQNSGAAAHAGFEAAGSGSSEAHLLKGDLPMGASSSAGAASKLATGDGEETILRPPMQSRTANIPAASVKPAMERAEQQHGEHADSNGAAAPKAVSGNASQHPLLLHFHSSALENKFCVWHDAQLTKVDRVAWIVMLALWLVVGCMPPLYVLRHMPGIFVPLGVCYASPLLLLHYSRPTYLRWRALLLGAIIALNNLHTVVFMPRLLPALPLDPARFPTFFRGLGVECMAVLALAFQLRLRVFIPLQLAVLAALLTVMLPQACASYRPGAVGQCLVTGGALQVGLGLLAPLAVVWTLEKSSRALFVSRMQRG